jgi:aldose 1-epimerase
MSQLLTLIDPATGSTAKIAPAFGFNCFSYQPQLNGEPVELLWSLPEFATTGAKPMASGIPILFPYAGRLRGTTLHYAGRDYPLQIDTRLNFAIHGFVYNRPWRVIDQTPGSATGEFHASRDDPQLADLWPGDFRIRACYEVHRGGLTCTLTADNPGDRPLPWGLGTHGYFRLPLGSAGDRERCIVSVPARSFWELGGMLPTGRKLLADGTRGIQGGLPFGQMQLDDVFTDLDPGATGKRSLPVEPNAAHWPTALTSATHRVMCRIIDPDNGRRLLVVFDELFRECVVFNPPHREAVCIEPYTCAPDAFSLEARGIASGLRVLQPGESKQVRIDLRFEEI